MTNARVISVSALLLGASFLGGCATLLASPTEGVVLNDVHSRLNPTRVETVQYPHNTSDVVRMIRAAAQHGRAVSISGGRHAMGGQQFGTGTAHISMTEMDDVLALDKQRGIVTVEAGTEWPDLMDELADRQRGDAQPWGIIQKQTGADRLTIGGALSANAHGRGTGFKPIIQDVESFILVNAEGEQLRCSRTENSELFALAIGGYGLFGVITEVDLRLQRRYKLRRVVELISLEDLPSKARERLEDGFTYGDFQYKTDDAAEDFMKVGVLSAYKPVATDTPVPDDQRGLTPEQWYHLVHFAHADKAKAFEVYSEHYLATDGQIYWSDSHQMSFYVEGYIEYLEKVMPDYPKGSLMISEVYVPRDRLTDFIEQVIKDVREQQMNVVYGTMRLIERDDESFLAWAKQDYACIIFNLRVEHSDEGLERARRQFQTLIDRALERGGSYFLTYHRWARPDQVLAAYPQFIDFLRNKLRYDPQQRFQSEWYRYYRDVFADKLGLPEEESRLSSGGAAEDRTPQSSWEFEEDFRLGQASAGERIEELAAALIRNVQATDLYKRGTRAFRRNRYRQAVSYFRRALELNPDFYYVYNDMGLAYKKLGQDQDAVASFDAALRIKPDYHMALNNRGIMRERLDDNDAALDDYTAAINADPFYAYAYFNRGNIYKKRGMDDLAIADYSEAITLKYNYAPAFNNRGILYQKIEDYDAAAADYDKALESNPEYAYACNNRAIIHEKKGEWEQAIELYSRALEIKPDYQTAYYNRGNAYRQTGQWKDAVRDYSRVIKLAPGLSKAYYQRGRSYKELGRYRKAVRDLTKVIELGKGFNDSYLERAEVYLQLHKTEQSRQDIEKAKELGLKVSADLLKKVEQVVDISGQREADREK
ncbi:MAG: tetratricopeptide repeat protein [Candidatus Omnitrophica bacterium]|nr:tetratricopeptide repeat protein [Candidatus Omnitrophota bacterium]